MNLATLNIQKATLKQALFELEAIKVNCLHCESYSGEICQQFKASPPPEWVNGPVDCEHWVFDGIPF